MQPEPPAAGRPRGGRGGGGRRRRADLQHDRGVGQSVAGHARDAGLAGLTRGDRGLDRADGRRPRLRCGALPSRLRQDRPGRADGACAYRPPRARALGRPDARRPRKRPRAHRPGPVGGGRRARARATVARRSRRGGAGGLPGSWLLLGKLHGEHDGDRDRLPRARCDRRRSDPGRPTSRRRMPRRPARARLRSPWPSAERPLGAF